jgi:hypothetical protein
MKKLKEYDFIDPIWDLVIMFIECCLGGTSLKSREKNVKDILKSLKEFAGNEEKKLFHYLSDMLILSFSSQETIERGWVYKEIVKVQAHLPKIKQLLNKAYLMKYSREDTQILLKEIEKELSKEGDLIASETDK